MDIEYAQRLINEKKYEQAAMLLDELLSAEKEDADLWFVRGMVSLKLKNYDMALEYFERALVIEKKPEYYRIKGMAHFEIFELEDAIYDFKNAIELDEKDITSNFFLSIAYMFMDDPRSEEYLKRAKGIDSKKTKQLLNNFYAFFLKDNPALSDAQKRKIEKRIGSIR